MVKVDEIKIDGAQVLYFKQSNEETKGTVLQDYKHVIIIVSTRSCTSPVHS